MAKRKVKKTSKKKAVGRYRSCSFELKDLGASPRGRKAKKFSTKHKTLSAAKRAGKIEAERLGYYDYHDIEIVKVCKRRRKGARPLRVDVAVCSAFDCFPSRL